MKLNQLRMSEWYRTTSGNEHEEENAKTLILYKQCFLSISIEEHIVLI